MQKFLECQKFLWPRAFESPSDNISFMEKSFWVIENSPKNGLDGGQKTWYRNFWGVRNLCRWYPKNLSKKCFFLILFFQKWPIYDRKRVWGSENLFYIINECIWHKKIMLKHKIWEQIFEVLSCLFASFYLACLTFVGFLETNKLVL